MLWGISPSDFWAMHPDEFQWQLEARVAKSRYRPGQITENEALEMKDELRRARAKAGFSPE